MVKHTIKGLKELLEIGDDLILKETDEDIQYTLVSDDTSFLGIKRKWEPEHPAEQDGWVDLAVISGITPQDVVRRDIIQDLDDSHQEWLEEHEEADVYFNK